jgi:hypothetical protein
MLSVFLCCERNQASYSYNLASSYSYMKLDFAHNTEIQTTFGQTELLRSYDTDIHDFYVLCITNLTNSIQPTQLTKLN